MNNILEYKGYHTKVELDTNSMMLRGILEGTNDYVDFEATSIKDVAREFRLAVDGYLIFAKK